WKFKGSDLLFGMLLFGCFVPFQVVLLPMAATLGKLGMANTTAGLVLVHVIYGVAFTTLFFRNFYVGIPNELVSAAKLDGAGFFRIFWRILLPVSAPIIVVSVIWQFTQIWNDFLFGASFASGDNAPMTVALNNIVNTTTGVKQYNVDMATALLTGLPNRLHLREALEAAILSSTRRGRPFALFYLDLDNFGQINDQYGRNAGDRVLQIIAERLRQAIRGEDTVARLGGDEFGILVEGLALPESAATIGDKLLFRLRESVEVEGRRLRATASIGVVVHPHNGATADTLLEHADTAMFDCKQSTGNAYRFFEPRLNTTAHRVLQIQRALSHAALNGQLSVYYQPKYDARTQAMAGAEALLRWNHPELGPVSPAEFIPLAERTGTIVELGDWVVEEVCRQIMHWDAIGMAPQRIAVNLSPRQFQQPDLVQRLSQILHRYQVAAHRLMFEITETAAMRDASQSIAVIRQIQSLGFEVAIDDFGTGYSSLSYLQRFRAQQIKIDRAFVSALDDNPPEAAAIIRAICAMAHSLDMTVVAEGVETEAQMQALVNLQCDQVQGYLLARPMPAKDFQGLLGVEYA
ncbi:EAL domain-containing protein, partial [Ralstonia sp.]|uniref:EAL domain-containing protein n=1 Tax=Ralstonia sp. TaxID=54061 RepID=UPI001A41A5CA